MLHQPPEIDPPPNHPKIIDFAFDSDFNISSPPQSSNPSKCQTESSITSNPSKCQTESSITSNPSKCQTESSIDSILQNSSFSSWGDKKMTLWELYRIHLTQMERIYSNRIYLDGQMIIDDDEVITKINIENTCQNVIYEFNIFHSIVRSIKLEYINKDIHLKIEDYETIVTIIDAQYNVYIHKILIKYQPLTDDLVFSLIDQHNQLLIFPSPEQIYISFKICLDLTQIYNNNPITIHY
jgi:hypothetical protein